MICAGIDAGSQAIKVVIMDDEGPDILASGTVDQGVNQGALAVGLFDRLLKEKAFDRDRVSKIVATGAGRNAVALADTTITEITCHARGIAHAMEDVRTIVEIGGQDSKLIRLDPSGAVRDFAMNDRCAAGTGRFLEIVADRLETDLKELGGLAERSDAPAAISSMCVVFAETEILGLLAGGASAEDIAAGVQASLAARIAAMAGGSVETPIAFTGGVALVPGMKEALQAALGHPVERAPNPRMTGALGAALLASER